MKKLLLMLMLLCTSFLGAFAVNYSDWLGGGSAEYAGKMKIETPLPDGVGVVNIQNSFGTKQGIYMTFPSGVSSCSLGDGNYAIQGAGILLYCDAFTQQETEVTVSYAGGNATFHVFYADGGSTPPSPTVTYHVVGQHADNWKPETMTEAFIFTNAGNGTLTLHLDEFRIGDQGFKIVGGNEWGGFDKGCTDVASIGTAFTLEGGSDAANIYVAKRGMDVTLHNVTFTLALDGSGVPTTLKIDANENYYTKENYVNYNDQTYDLVGSWSSDWSAQKPFTYDPTEKAYVLEYKNFSYQFKVRKGGNWDYPMSYTENAISLDTPYNFVFNNGNGEVNNAKLASNVNQAKFILVPNGDNVTLTVKELQPSVDPPVDPDPDNLFIAANSSIADSYFSNADWSSNESSASYNPSTGKLTVNLKQENTRRWQSQVKLATGITYEPGYQYDLTFKIKSTQPLYNMLAKLDNKDGIFIREGLATSANEEKTISITNYTYTGGVTDGLLVFDFGTNVIPMDIEIYDITIHKHEPAGGILGANLTAADDDRTPAEYSGYTLAWSDEFDKARVGDDENQTTGLPISKYWNVEIVHSPDNNELQYYTENGVFVNKGNLILTATKQDFENRKFTSGRVNTQGNVSFKYGRLEARIKMPDTSKGLWPAFWAMGNDFPTSGWPNCGELDIVEMGHSEGFDGNEGKFLNGALHYGQAWDQDVNDSYSTTLDNSIQDGNYHLFRCDWDEDWIICYVDGIEYFKKANTMGNYFKHFHYYLLNLAVGGNFPGITDPELITALADGPRSMYVDYVRVYQKDNNVIVTDDYLDGNDIRYNGDDTHTNAGRVYLIEGGNNTYDALKKKELLDLTPDGKNRNFLIWTQPYPDGQPSVPTATSTYNETDQYRRITVTDQRWSGTSYNLGFPFDLSGISDAYTLHMKVKASADCDNVTVGLYANGSSILTLDKTKLIGDTWKTVDIPLKNFYANGLTYTGSENVRGNVLSLSAGGKNGSTFDIAEIYIYGPADNDNYYVRPTDNLIQKGASTQFTLYNASGEAVQATNWTIAPSGAGTMTGNTYTASHAIPVIAIATTPTGKTVMSNIDVYADQSSVEIKKSTERETLNAGKYYVVNMGNDAFETIKDKAVDMRTKTVQGEGDTWANNELQVWADTFSDNEGTSKKSTDVAGSNQSIVNYAVTDKNWSGLGFNYSKPYDLSGISDDYVFHIEMASSIDFDYQINVIGSAESSIKLNPYKDSNNSNGWVVYDIPMSYFVAQGMYFDETMGNIVTINGASDENAALSLGAIYFYGDDTDEIGDIYIHNYAELQEFAHNVNTDPRYQTATAYLVSDINMTAEQSAEYEGIGKHVVIGEDVTTSIPFKGTFTSVKADDDPTPTYHTIYLNGTKTGVFDEVGGGASITGVYTAGTVNKTTANVGGLIDHVTGTGTVSITHCVNSAKINGTVKVAGTIGRVQGKYENNPLQIYLTSVLNEGDITADGTSNVNAAGIIGCSTAAVITARNIGNVGAITAAKYNEDNSKDYESAAFFGWIDNNSTIANSYNGGKVTGMSKDENGKDLNLYRPAYGITVTHLEPTEHYASVHDASYEGYNLSDRAAQGVSMNFHLNDVEYMHVFYNLKRSDDRFPKLDENDGPVYPWIQENSGEGYHPVFRDTPLPVDRSYVFIDQTTNTTAWAHVTPIKGEGPLTVTATFNKVSWDDQHEYADDKLETLSFTLSNVAVGSTVDIPMYYLLPNTADQVLTVTVKDKNGSVVETLTEKYTTLTHQAVAPEDPRQELMDDNLEPMVAYNPGFGGYKLVKDYNFDSETRTYSYTMPENPNGRWTAQFRKLLKINDDNKVVSLYDKFEYKINIEFEVEGPTVDELILDVKIEETETGNQGWDGRKFIASKKISDIKKDGEGKYIYSWTADHIKLPEGLTSIDGAILVIDLGQVGVDNATVKIKNLSVYEKEKTNLPESYNNEYYIYTPQQMDAFAKGVNDGSIPTDAKAYLMADIDMTELGADYNYPGVSDSNTKRFKGSFISLSDKDDKSKTTEHTIKLGNSTTGVFGYVNGAYIEGVNVEGVINASTDNVGAIVNNSVGNTTIVNCENAATVTSTANNAAGIVGYVFDNGGTDGNRNTLTIRNVVNRGDITAETKAAGIIGFIQHTNLVMINALNEGDITSSKTAENANAAGLVGCQVYENVSTTVVNSGNAGNISGKAGECAAFFGWIESKDNVSFTNCYNSGNIDGQQSDMNLVRSNKIASDKLKPSGDNTIWHNVYDASTAAGQNPVGKGQGWTLKQDQSPWTKNDVLDGTLLGAVNGATVAADVLPWVQTVVADLHPVFVASDAVKIPADVQDITNTTAVIHIDPIAIDGLPITLKYEWLKPNAPTKNGEGVANDPVKETHYHTIIAKAGEDIYTPVMNLENFANQTVYVMVGNTQVADPITFTTLDHQKNYTDPSDLPTGKGSERGQLMKNNELEGTLRPIVDFEPGWKGYKDVENYNADVAGGVYSYTMPDATNARWQAQFRIPIGSESGKVVSLSPEYDYDVALTIKSSKPANLIFKLESSETGWRNKDGEIDIITNDHGTLTAEEIGTDGYVYEVQNIKGKYLPGALLVIDLAFAEANTDVTISNISVIEKARTSDPTIIDPNKKNSKLDGSAHSVTNNSVTLDMKGYDKDGSDFVDGKEVIYTISTNVGTPESPEIMSWTTTGVGGKINSYVVSGLDKGTNYTFNIKAQLEDGSVVGPSTGVDVTATTLDYDLTMNGILYAKNKDPKDGTTDNNEVGNAVNHTNNQNSGAHDETPDAGKNTTVPFASGNNAGKIINEWPYSIGYSVTKNADGSLTIEGGIDSESANIQEMCLPTIWFTNTGEGAYQWMFDRVGEDGGTRAGTPDAFVYTVPATHPAAQNYNPDVTRIDYRFPFTSGGFINSGYVSTKETRGDLTLNAGVAQTTKKTADLYMNAANGTTENITYKIYEGAATSVGDAETKPLLATTSGTAGTNTTYTMGGLEPDHEYIYTIVAIDGDGQKAFQVVRPKTLPDNLAPVEFDNTVDGTAKYVWLMGTDSSNRQTIDYTYSFNLDYNADGSLTMIGGVGPQGDNTKSVSDAVGLVLPHVFIKKATESTWTDVQAPAGKPTEFYYTTTAPGPYAKGDVVEVKVKYEYNGLNGESQFTTPTMRFVVDDPESGDVKTYHYFNESYTSLDGYHGTSNRVRIVRSLKDGNWNTFTVPFYLTKGELEEILKTHKDENGTVLSADVEKLSSLETNDDDNYVMHFTSIEDEEILEAGKPYMIKLTGNDHKVDGLDTNAAIKSFDLVGNASRQTIDLNTVVQPATTVTSGDKSVSFHSTYTFMNTQNYVPRGSYIINQSKLYHVNSNVQMYGFRGYFTIDDVPASSSAKMISYVFDKFEDNDDIVTGIDDNFDMNGIDFSKPVYNIKGQRVSKSTKGILIQNGHKYVNK